MIKGINKILTIALSLLIVFSLIAPTFAQRRRDETVTPGKKTAKAHEATEKESCSLWTGSVEVTRRRAESHTKVTNKGEHMSDQFYSGKAEIKTSYDYKGTFNISNSTGRTNEDGSQSVSLKGIVGADALRVQEEKDNWKTETDCFPETQSN